VIRVPSDRSADPARSADPVDRAGHPRPGDPAGLVRLEPVPWLAEVRPIDAAEAFRSLPGLALLESARPGRNARWTFLTADPIAVLTEPAAGADPFAVARRLLARLSRPGDEAGTDGRSRGQDRHGQYGGDQRDRDDRGTRAADRPPFIGGLVGYLGYELGDVLERLPAPPADDQGLPLLRLALHDWAIAWDRRTGTAWLGGRAIDADASRLDRRLTDVRRRLAIALGGPSRQSGDSAEARAFPGGTRGDETQRGRDLVFRSSLDRGAYEAGVEAIRDEIARGSIYQANLTRRLETPFDADPWPLYRRLRTGDPALFSAYLDLGTGAPGHGSVDGTAPARPRAILSASPEPFLSVDASGRVSTDPIKGTRPRGRTRDEDRALARELLESAKDRAENVMIVDVLRNDLGRVCRPGTVRVPRLCRLERTVAVQHLVSTITGQLAAGRDAFDLLAAAFPGGSITGAPKIRAQEILRSLEPTRRGPYTGTLGWIGPDGAMAASILIRTYVADGARLSLHVGGGITARSVPAEEWAETVAKAHGPLDAIGGRELADPIADREVAAAVASTDAA
jgi:para-aminobenzoate synthetase component I